MNKLLFFLFFLSVAASGNAQELSTEDVLLVKQKNFQVLSEKKYNRSGNDTKVLQAKTSSTFARYNPVSLTLKGTMALYQQVLSPQLSRSCPYEITCSNFSKHAIKEFGIVKGLFLSADRVLRCNRIGLLDVHPLNINDHNGTISDPMEQYRIR